MFGKNRAKYTNINTNIKLAKKISKQGEPGLLEKAGLIKHRQGKRGLLQKWGWKSDFSAAGKRDYEIRSQSNFGKYRLRSRAYRRYNDY